jgi:hypothetical protein
VIPPIKAVWPEPGDVIRLRYINKEEFFMRRPYDLSYLYDPEIYAVNRLPAVSDHDCYRTLEEAEAETTSLSLCLNGEWQFFYTENPAECPENFWQPEFDRSQWAQIKVPGHIQLQGYGTPHYTNVPYPWDGHERLTPPAFSLTTKYASSKQSLPVFFI